MKTGKFALIITSVLLSFSLSSQTPEIERLTQLLESINGQEKVQALADLSKAYYAIDPEKGIKYGEWGLNLADSLKMYFLKGKLFDHIGLCFWSVSDFDNARTYFNKALKYATKYKDSLAMAKAFNHLGLICEAKADYDSCLILFNKQLEIYKKLNLTKETGNALENIGTIHLYRGELKSAISNLLEAADIYQKNNNEQALGYTYLKLGSIYSESNEYDEAIRWTEKGMNLCLKNNDLIRAAIGMNTLGIIYKNKGKYEEALGLFKEAIELVWKMNPKVLINRIYTNIGNVYTLQKKYDQALSYHKKALDLSTELNFPNDIAIQNVNLGEVYYAQNDFEKAKRYYESALPVFEENKSWSNLLSTYEALINVNNELRDFESSAKYYQSYITIKDSLNQHELNRALDSLKVKFSTEQTEMENKTLHQETELQDKKILIQRIIMFSAFFLILLFVILVFMIIRSRLRMKRSNELLEQKNKEISSQAKKLESINLKLTELSEFKDVMNSFLVHDLKVPLNKIIHINRNQISEKEINSIKQAGKNMLNLVLNILDLSKFEKKSMELAFDNLYLKQMVQQAMEEVRYLADQKSIEFKIKLVRDISIKADPEIMNRVLINLFTNAIKFSANGQTIEVSSTVTAKDFLHISVKDHGEGIEKQYIPLLFKRFTQRRSIHSNSIRSSGLGLSFCKMAVEAHGGEIGADSIVGEGSTFWFTLPLSVGADQQPADYVEMVEKPSNGLDLVLKKEDIRYLLPFCNQLRHISIQQISDVKDVLKNLTEDHTEQVKKWKESIIKALYEINELDYQNLLNLVKDE